MNDRTESDLVSFGNYLLSEQRRKTIVNKINEDKVHHSDIENWKQAEQKELRESGEPTKSESILLQLGNKFA